MKRAALSLTVLLAELLARVAGAQTAPSDTSDLQSLLQENVVTTASKSAETSTTAPATSSTLTAEDMRRYGIHSIAEAIDFLSLGAVTADPLSTVEIGARGVLLSADSGDHFLLLVDGHAVNEPYFGAARFDHGAGVPIEMVDHIEVVLGPGSVLYGSNAMLGVINVITKRAKDWHGTHAAAEGDVGQAQVDSSHLARLPDAERSQLDGWQTSNRLGLLSWRLMGGAGYEFTLLGKPAEITAAIEYFQQDGPAFTFGPQYGGIDYTSAQLDQFTRPPLPATGWWGGIADKDYYTREPGGQLHVAWGAFDLSVHASTFKRASPYRSRFTHAVEDFNDPDSYDLDRSLWVDLRHKVALSQLVELTSRAYVDSNDFQATQNTSLVSGCVGLPVTGANPTCTYKGISASRWVGLEEQMALDWLRDGSLVTLIGVDGRVRFIGGKFDTSDFNTGKPIHPSESVLSKYDQLVGVYAQQTWQPADWLGLNAGARFDEETRYQGNVSPRIAASARAWQGGTFKAIYAEAFRSPSWGETTLRTPEQIPGGDLKPERVRSIEGSFEQRFGAHRLLFGGFRSWWSDLVELHALTTQETAQATSAGLVNGLTDYGVVQYRNVSSIDNWGFNAAYEGASGEQLRWGATVTGAIARRNDPSLPGAPIEPLTVTPSVFGNARISYDLPGDLPNVAVAAQWMGKRYADRAFTGGWPNALLPVAPPQLELRVTISGPVPGLKGLTYRVGANWALADRAPYLAGPLQDSGSICAISPACRTLPSSGPNVPQLVPVDPFRVMGGLQYDFLP
jgi:outer membrane receptor protein involved in Fe transport